MAAFAAFFMPGGRKIVSPLYWNFGSEGSGTRLSEENSKIVT